MHGPTRSFRASMAGVAIAVATLPSPSFGQNVISAMAGYIHHVEGEVFLANRQIEPAPTEFLHVLDGQRLRTGEGRAEIMLTPGSFLRLDAHSEIEMISAGLARARLRVTNGSAIVHLLSIFEKDSIAVLAGEGEVHFPRPGLYRVNAVSPPPALKVFRGKAVVLAADQRHELKGRRTVALSGIEAAIEKFDPKQKDPLDEWNRTRTEVLVKMVRDRRGQDDGGMDPLYRQWIEMTLRRPQAPPTPRMPESRSPQPQPSPPSSSPRSR